MEQRQPVHQGVLSAPLPGRRQGVDVGGDGAAADQHALGQSGGAGGVHHHRGALRRRLGIAVPRARVQTHRHVRQPARLVGHLPQPRLRPGIGEHVRPLGHADVGGHRHERHAGDQATGDREHGRRRRRGQDRDPLRPADPLGHRGRRTHEITAREHRAVDAHRITDVGASRGSRIQRGQQHVREATPILALCSPSPRSPPARSTAMPG